MKSEPSQWYDWIGAEPQADGTVVLDMMGPVRPMVIEVRGLVDAHQGAQEILQRQFREKFI
jgi:hypothetical protein